MRPIVRALLALRLLFPVVILMMIVFTPRHAFAQQQPQQPQQQPAPKSEADRLFEEGLALLDAGRFAEACAKLDASHRVDPAPGTLLSLGDCHAKAGKTASAWRAFREASEFARRIGDGERARVATSRAAALEQSLSKLTIAVTPQPDGGVPIRVQRDGVAVEPALWGVAVAVDPASYTISATAQGREPFTSKVDLQDAAGKTVTVTVPILTATTPTTPPSSAALTTTTPKPEQPFFTTRRSIATGVGAIGLIAIGVGSFFAINASSDWSDARSRCGGDSSGSGSDPLRCSDPSAAEQGRSAGRQADVATVSVAIGVVALAAAVVLWVTDPERR